MHILAIDTATPAVTAGLVELHTDQVRTVATRVTVDPRAHAEVLTPQILECLAEAGWTMADIDAVVVGDGPGPFTGLRVGLATAAALGDALGVPVHGVCSLDGIAVEAATDSGEELLVVTDARRREVYWARYRGSGGLDPSRGSGGLDPSRGSGGLGPSDSALIRIEGPAVATYAVAERGAATAVAGSPTHAALFDLPVVTPSTPSPVGLVRCAASELLSGAVPAPLTPRYLRRPDAVEPKAMRKAVAR